MPTTRPTHRVRRVRPFIPSPFPAVSTCLHGSRSRARPSIHGHAAPSRSCLLEAQVLRRWKPRPRKAAPPLHESREVLQRCSTATFQPQNSQGERAPTTALLGIGSTTGPRGEDGPVFSRGKEREAQGSCIRRGTKGGGRGKRGCRRGPGVAASSPAGRRGEPEPPGRTPGVRQAGSRAVRYGPRLAVADLTHPVAAAPAGAGLVREPFPPGGGHAGPEGSTPPGTWAAAGRLHAGRNAAWAPRSRPPAGADPGSNREGNREADTYRTTYPHRVEALMCSLRVG
jgi:hypothetical protein